MKRFLLLLFIAMVLFFTACSSNPADSFQIDLLKVGKADAIILRTTKSTILIDSAEEEDGAEILDFFTKQGIDEIDFLILTHFDKDHIGGAPDLINNIAIKTVYMPSYEKTTKYTSRLFEAFSENNLTPTVLTEPISFSLDDVSFLINPPKQQSYENDNDYSLIVEATYKNNSFLFAGDALDERLSELNISHPYTFLKLPHHGNFEKTTVDFLTAVSPSCAAVTCSKKNPCDPSTIAALNSIGCKTYFTTDGDIHITSNGTTISVTQS